VLLDLLGASWRLGRAKNSSAGREEEAFVASAPADAKKWSRLLRWCRVFLTSDAGNLSRGRYLTIIPICTVCQPSCTSQHHPHTESPETRRRSCSSSLGPGSASRNTRYCKADENKSRPTATPAQRGLVGHEIFSVVLLVQDMNRRLPIHTFKSS
jgi:hypothetical protein